MPDANINGQVIPFKRRKRPLTAPRALALIRSKEVIEVASIAALGDMLGWQRSRTGKALKRWEDAGQIAVSRHGDGSLTIRALPVDPVALREFGPGDNRERPSRRKRASRPRKEPKTRVRRRKQTAAEVEAEDREIFATYDLPRERENARETGVETISKVGVRPGAYRDKRPPESAPAARPVAASWNGGEYLHQGAPASGGNTATSAGPAPSALGANSPPRQAADALAGFLSAVWREAVRVTPTHRPAAETVAQISGPRLADRVTQNRATRSAAGNAEHSTQNLGECFQAEGTDQPLLKNRGQGFATETRAEQTHTEVADHAPADHYAEDHPPTTYAERPVWRRSGGGGVTGGGGFDAVETFGRASGPEKLLILIAAGLSGVAAFMSVSGMVVLYPLEPTTIMVFGGLIEAAKFCGFAIVIGGWRHYAGIGKWAAGLLLIVAAVINASGVYGKLIANHTTTAAGRTAAFAQQDADQGAKIDVANGRLSDIDRRLSLIDGASEGAARRGRTQSAIRAMEQQRRQRATLASERQSAQTEVANLRAGRTGMQARHTEDEAAATPVRYAAALFEDVGAIAPGTDPEKLMRWLSFLLLLSGDPLALALMVAINSRTRGTA